MIKYLEALAGFGFCLLIGLFFLYGSCQESKSPEKLKYSMEKIAICKKSCEEIGKADYYSSFFGCRCEDKK